LYHVLQIDLKRYC